MYKDTKTRHMLDTCSTHAAHMQPGEKEESDCSLSQLPYGGPDWGLGAPEGEAAPGGRQSGGEGEGHTHPSTHYGT